jgi:hypothetical protein
VRRLVRIRLCAPAFAICLVIGACGGQGHATRLFATGALAWERNPAVWTFLRYQGREPAQTAWIDRAESYIIRACLKHAGYRPPALPSGDSSSPDTALAATPGPAPPDETSALGLASATGLGVYSTSIGDERRHAAARRLISYLNALAPSAQQQFNVTLQGSDKDVERVVIPAGGGTDLVPRHGCNAQAAVAVFGSVADDDIRLNLGAEILHLLEVSAFSTSNFVAAEPRWSSCASKALGMHVSSEGSLATWVQSQYDRRGLNRQTRAIETHAALAEVSCAYASGLARAYATGIWSAALQMPKAWFADLENALRWDTAATGRARALLASTAGSRSAARTKP